MAFRRRRIRQRSEWTGVTSVAPTTVPVNTNAASVILGATALEEWPGGSLARIIGHLFLSPATAPAAPTGYGVFFGITWETVGVTNASHDPELWLDHRWKWWNCCFPQIGGTAAADSNASRWVGYFALQMDLRRLGRWDTDRQLYLYVKNSNSSGASVQFSYAFRFLIIAGRR